MKASLTSEVSECSTFPVTPQYHVPVAVVVYREAFLSQGRAEKFAAVLPSSVHPPSLLSSAVTHVALGVPASAAQCLRRTTGSAVTVMDAGWTSGAEGVVDSGAAELPGPSAIGEVELRTWRSRCVLDTLAVIATAIPTRTATDAATTRIVRRDARRGGRDGAGPPGSSSHSIL